MAVRSYARGLKGSVRTWRVFGGSAPVCVEISITDGAAETITDFVTTRDALGCLRGHEDIKFLRARRPPDEVKNFAGWGKDEEFPGKHGYLGGLRFDCELQRGGSLPQRTGQALGPYSPMCVCGRFAFGRVDWCW